MLTPQIDARLAGVEKRGDKLVVHSLSGHERNHYFSNRSGKAFTDLSALSGLDNPADSRGWALLDYDRDGWQDVALVNANEPLFNLYHNQMPAAGFKGGIIAVKFVGGNKTSMPSKWASRDGYGAVLTAALGDITLTREHRCGDGFAAQHSAVMMLGLGARPSAAAITVRWPSGQTMRLESITEGTLLTCYENAADSKDGSGFARESYRPGIGAGIGAGVAPRVPVVAAGSVSDFAAADTASRPGTRLRVYTSMATWCAACAARVPDFTHIAEEGAAEGIELIGVPVDVADDTAKLAAYTEGKALPYRLMRDLSAAGRNAFTAELTKRLAGEPPLPATLITDHAGRVLLSMEGVPQLSELRRMLSVMPPDPAK